MITTIVIATLHPKIDCKLKVWRSFDKMHVVVCEESDDERDSTTSDQQGLENW